MPQMSPMYWESLTLMTLLIAHALSNKMYFNTHSKKAYLTESSKSKPSKEANSWKW